MKNFLLVFLEYSVKTRQLSKGSVDEFWRWLHLIYEKVLVRGTKFSLNYFPNHD
jgi:hypothetical protein